MESVLICIIAVLLILLLLLSIKHYKRDILGRKVMEDKLYRLAYYDTLTKLPNRAFFEKKVNKMLKRAEESGEKMALLYFDIDDFKNVNEILGHKIGDELLKHIVNIVNTFVKTPNFCARLSGDEFVIVLKKVTDKDLIIKDVEEFLTEIKKPWVFEGNEFFITISMGIAVYPEDGLDLESLYKNVDASVNYVKSRGKDGYEFYDSDMQEKTLKRISMINSLRHAIENKEFTLYYQPQIELKTGKIKGVEALIRWFHPEKGFIPPDQFIPLAEEVGYIRQIDEWVVETACKQKKLWNEAGYNIGKMSVNISSKRLVQEDFVESLKSTINEYGLDYSELEIEITETAIIYDLDSVVKIIKQLKEIGVSIALDDFGTGYSSLTYLKKLPINVLKIDREFIQSIINNNEEEFIVKSVIKLAHNLKLQVVAEGVETHEQATFLKEDGCEVGQGYLYSKAVTPGEIEKLLNNEKII